ncbi:hypothetical protein GJR88_01763 [Dietzia sp. DQ12-45-1b]|nr:hypothetical protein GJR88_01763 [Dietzia sp. DQ12-45-1b]
MHPVPAVAAADADADADAESEHPPRRDGSAVGVGYCLT